MTSQAMSLAELQREMAAAILLPLTSEETMHERTPDGRSTREIAERFLAPNSRLTAFDRLEIYNRQYWFRVLGALAEDFPVLRSVVGSHRYEALAEAYLTAHPSRSFSLRNLGSQLVDWLIAHPQFTGRRHRLAIDVARIEWAFIEAFDQAALVPLSAAEAALIHPESRLTLQPHLQLLALNYPADNLVLTRNHPPKREASEGALPREVDEAAPIPLPSIRPRPTWLAVHRVDLSVYFRRLQREEYQALVALRDGKSLQEAIEAGFEGSTLAPERHPENVRAWFAHWAEHGWLCSSVKAE